MPSKFAKALAEKLKEKGLKPIDLEKKSVATRQNLSRLLNDTPHPVSGALPKAREKTVEKIAKFLDWDINEARTAAGYAIENGITESDLDDTLMRTIYHKYNKITPEKREEFRKILEMVDRELDALGIPKEESNAQIP